MSNEQVLLFYPNLVGYARIVLALIAFEAMPYAPWRAGFCYAVSALLDAVDGHLARAFNQTSRFGAMLDQLTDRMTTLGLIIVLADFYPRFMFLLQISAVIDIASHWLYLHAVDLTNRSTHKQSNNPILHLYYTNRHFLFAMCAGNEAFYGLLYVYHFISTHPMAILVQVMIVICSPIALVKSLISLVHLVEAANEVVAHDVQKIRAKN